jgi:hypothetical protein
MAGQTDYSRHRSWWDHPRPRGTYRVPPAELRHSLAGSSPLSTRPPRTVGRLTRHDAVGVHFIYTHADELEVIPEDGSIAALGFDAAVGASACRTRFRTFRRRSRPSENLRSVACSG